LDGKGIGMTPDEHIKKWNEDRLNGESTLFTERLKSGLTMAQICFVLDTLDGICHDCWDRDKGCQCWNDE
jgi:hypothetical protein